MCDSCYVVIKLFTNHINSSKLFDLVIETEGTPELPQLQGEVESTSHLKLLWIRSWRVHWKVHQNPSNASRLKDFQLVAWGLEKLNNFMLFHCFFCLFYSFSFDEWNMNLIFSSSIFCFFKRLQDEQNKARVMRWKRRNKCELKTLWNDWKRECETKSFLQKEMSSRSFILLVRKKRFENWYELKCWIRDFLCFWIWKFLRSN